MSARKFMGLAAAAAVALAVSTAAKAETVLKISSWAPPTHGINAIVFPTWANWLEEATDGRVKAEIVYRLGPPPRQFDLIRDGVADVSWIFHGYNPGQFVSTQAAEMPLLGANAEAASVAYWRTYQEYMKDALDAEHEGIMVIGLTAGGAGVIQTRQQISSWSDLRGLKIRVPGGVASQLGEALGVIKVSVPAPQVYETLQSRVADGVFMPMETHRSFRLHEVTSHILRVPGNFYNGSFALIMNPQTFARLEARDREAIMRVSGERLSAMAGRMWDAKDREGEAQAQEAGTTVRDADGSMMNEFRAIAKQLEDQWVERVGESFDARTALAFLREEARNYRSRQ